MAIIGYARVSTQAAGETLAEIAKSYAVRPQHDLTTDLILSEIARPGWRPRQQQSQRKTDAAGDQQRTERVFLHFLRQGLRAVAESIAAVLVSVFCVADGGIRSIACRIFGLAVQVLRRSRRLADFARGLGHCITGNTADGALDLTREIPRRAGNSIVVHGALS
jgi:hypothetical protein